MQAWGSTHVHGKDKDILVGPPTVGQAILLFCLNSVGVCKMTASFPGETILRISVASFLGEQRAICKPSMNPCRMYCILYSTFGSCSSAKLQPFYT